MPGEIKKALISACWPPTVAVIGSAMGAAPVVSLPAGTAGLLGPKPVPKSKIVSFGLAGCVVTPAISPGGPRYVPSEWTPAGRLAANRNKAGERNGLGTEKALLVPAGVVTCTSIAPMVASSGTITFS